MRYFNFQLSFNMKIIFIIILLTLCSSCSTHKEESTQYLQYSENQARILEDLTAQFQESIKADNLYKGEQQFCSIYQLLKEWKAESNKNKKLDKAQADLQYINELIHYMNLDMVLKERRFDCSSVQVSSQYNEPVIESSPMHDNYGDAIEEEFPNLYYHYSESKKELEKFMTAKQVDTPHNPVPYNPQTLCNAIKYLKELQVQEDVDPETFQLVMSHYNTFINITEEQQFLQDLYTYFENTFGEVPCGRYYDMAEQKFYN